MKPVPKGAGASACCTRDRRRAHDPPGHPGHAAAWVQLGLGLWPDADDPLEELVESLADAEGAVSWSVWPMAKRWGLPKCACAMTT